LGLAICLGGGVSRLCGLVRALAVHWDERFACVVGDLGWFLRGVPASVGCACFFWGWLGFAG
jgi:hypothetical protein